MYRLERLAQGTARRINITDDLSEIERHHMDALSREIDSQINKHRREINVIASSFVSRVTCNISGERIVSFQIVGEPIFQDSSNSFLDDTDSLDVSALRRKLATGEKR